MPKHTSIELTFIVNLSPPFFSSSILCHGAQHFYIKVMYLKNVLLFCIVLVTIHLGLISASATDGGADMSFSAGNLFNMDVYALVVQPDGKILVGGDFFEPGGGTAPNGIARLNADGTRDLTFGGAGGSQVRSVALQPDGKVLIGGYFTIADGAPRQRIARLNSDGTIDNTFDPGTGVDGNDRLIDAIVVLPNGQILIGGDFTSVNGIARNNIARLNANGSVDETFNAGAVIAGSSGIIFDIVMQGEQILVAGAFDSIGGGTTKGVARLNANGTIDNTFNAGGAGTNSGVSFIKLQADGKIVIGGFFISYNGTTRNRLARINADGSLDTSFAPNVGGMGDAARDAVVLPNRKIVVVGNFDSINSVAGNRIARLNEDGSVDRSFRSGTNGPVDYVHASVLQNDGKILVGGSFAGVAGKSRKNIARLTNEALADFDGDGKSDISVFRPADRTWYLQQSNAGFSAYPFGLSTDRLVPADYDGDGKTDAAVYRDGSWYILGSLTGFRAIQFGLSEDIPQPADFDGDGLTDIAVFRPSSGTWFTLNIVTSQFRATRFGSAEDRPTVGDYDGDGKADISVFRPSDAVWYRLNSSNNQFSATRFGLSEDQPVATDYDGDGKTDIAVFRPSEGNWYFLNSSDGQFVGFHWGNSTDKPVPGDYDGDGKADYGVYRDGVWYLQQSMSGFTAATFGLTDDKPLPVVP
jgi:uncharacterized delta-60 repeat protein